MEFSLRVEQGCITRTPDLTSTTHSGILSNDKNHFSVALPPIDHIKGHLRHRGI